MSDPNDIVQAYLIEEETFGSLVVLEDRKGDLVRIVPVTDAPPDTMHETLSDLVTNMVESGELSR